jgi:hypothetical protein
MRVRVALRALWTLAEMPQLLNTRRYGFYSVQLLSHKVLRYLAFVLMAALFGTAALLASHAWVYQTALVAQLGLAGVTLLGYVAERRRTPSRILSVPYYFALVNLAAVQAFLKFLKGERARTWNPRLG